MAETKPVPSMENVEGEGNRKDGEGQRGELLQEGRGRNSREGKRQRLKRNNAKCSLSIFVSSIGTTASTAT